MVWPNRSMYIARSSRVNLPFRWITQHIATCPLTGVMCCALPSCAKGLAEPGLRAGGNSKTKCAFFVGGWSSFLSKWVCLLRGRARIERWRKCCHSGHRSTGLAACSSWGSRPLSVGEGVGDCNGTVGTRNVALLGFLVVISRVEGETVFFFVAIVVSGVLTC